MCVCILTEAHVLLIFMEEVAEVAANGEKATLIHVSEIKLSNHQIVLRTCERCFFPPQEKSCSIKLNAFCN